MCFRVKILVVGLELEAIVSRRCTPIVSVPRHHLNLEAKLAHFIDHPFWENAVVRLLSTLVVGVAA